MAKLKEMKPIESDFYTDSNVVKAVVIALIVVLIGVAVFTLSSNNQVFTGTPSDTVIQK